MLFSSITFIYFFLPCVLLLYIVAPKTMKNGVLLVSSLFFYGWGEPKYLLLMIVTITVGYVFGRLIEDNRQNLKGKLLFILAILFSLGILVYFKYWDFFVDTINNVTGANIKLLKISLPIGISFYTFQLISYFIDVYRGDIRANRNIVKLSTYITMFPQLIAGPIVRYSHIAKQLDEKNLSIQRAGYGIRRFIVGLSKKVLLANVLGQLCVIYKETTDTSILFVWLYALCYMLQVYFDFSGYSDMAIGLGKVLGFDFPENFNYPYVSRSITEFWRRWHMTLGTWFRDYVYIPLGGNRVEKHRHIFNLLVVWMLTGLWHGAASTFVVWGVYFGTILIIEKYLLKKVHEWNRIISHVYVLVLCAISFVIFDADSLMSAFTNIKAMFGFGNIPLVSSTSVYYLKSYLLVMIISVIAATPIPKRIIGRIYRHSTGGKIVGILEPVILVILLLVVTAYLVDGSFNPFLYFRF